MITQKGAAAGLAAGLLLLGVLVGSAEAVSITSWGGTPEESGDDDVAAALLWGFGVALLWPNGHEAAPPPDPNGGTTGKDPVVPEASTLALVGLGAIVLLARRKRQK